MIKCCGILALAGILTLSAFGDPTTVPLFNGSNFNGLLRYLPNSVSDLDATWKIKEGGVLWCSGDPAGYIRTELKYKNYKLRVQWRWPGEGGNNGVLVHVQDKDEVWPKSFEMQMHSGNAGDIWVIGGANFKEHTNLIDRRVPMRHQSMEKPLGEWNQFEIICQDDRIEVYTNGVLQNVATECTLTEGYIALQSEGTPVEYREILLTPLEKSATNETE